MLLFFMPCEELTGGSIFQRLSSNYKCIQPYIEKVDASFIDHLNFKIRNINYYLNKKVIPDKKSVADDDFEDIQTNDANL